ncbi:head GIN domain-containing protein [Hymenobacter sp. B81]|uniref:head GIN domain-containing protein n=1 Tax=Hymenobacter sp. B81 TaxID=3344878 RepID=UPI0037DDD59E
MNKLSYLALGAALLTTLPAFHPAAATPAAAVAPAEDPRREVRPVADFSEVSLASSVEVEVRQGSTQRVEVIGAAADLARLETTVTNGRLRIGTKEQKGFSWKDFSGKVKVLVTAPQVKLLAVSGSGVLRAPEALRTNALRLSVSGSGRLQAPVQAQGAVEASVSGSGSIDVSGSAPSLSVAISGSGRVQAAELRVEAATARLSGSGSCRLQARQTLDAHISGSGSVQYTGQPRITKHISGSGRVVGS